ncbi:MAG: cytochrome c peroxidase [Bacteroidia bacterium]
MKAKLFYLVLIIAVVVFNLQSCKKESDLNPTRVMLDLSSADTSVTPLVTLGRVLFYDQHLSINNSISCASCHKQTIAFSDNLAFSEGFQGQLTLRNAPPIQNILEGGNNPRLFWDGRENVLATMVLRPIVNHVEMGMSNIGSIALRVKVQGYYAELFTNAFGSNEVTSDKIAQALSAFVASIKSKDTRFDKFNAGHLTLTALEGEGRQLFFTKYNCNSCHQTQHPSAYGFGGGGGFINIGLDEHYTDRGLGGFTNNPADDGKFKIPSMRNIALTAPYMHDGRFATLDQVLEHYSHGIKDHPNLDFRLRNFNNQQPIQMNITAYEKQALIAFMNAQTDFTMITDKRLSNPFIIH